MQIITNGTLCAYCTRIHPKHNVFCPFAHIFEDAARHQAYIIGVDVATSDWVDAAYEQVCRSIHRMSWIRRLYWSLLQRLCPAWLADTLRNAYIDSYSAAHCYHDRRVQASRSIE